MTGEENQGGVYKSRSGLKSCSPREELRRGQMGALAVHLTDGPHVLQVLPVLSQMKVPVHMEHELQVQVLPVGRVVDQIGVDAQPGLVV